jgi:hypothetical protein
MADYYADSSVLVKRPVNEIGSDWFRALADTATGNVIISFESGLTCKTANTLCGSCDTSFLGRSYPRPIVRSCMADSNPMNRFEFPKDLADTMCPIRLCQRFLVR